MNVTTPPSLPKRYNPIIRRGRLKKPLCDARDPMFDLVPKDAKVVVELGSAFGFWGYRCCKQLPNVTLYCVDPWKSMVWFRTPLNGYRVFEQWTWNMRHFIEKRRVFPIRATSHEAAKDFDLPIDFLFIDGDHSREGVAGDIRLWTPKVRLGGLIVGHDWKLKSVQDGVYDVVTNVNVDRLYLSTATRLTYCFWWRKGL